MSDAMIRGDARERLGSRPRGPRSRQAQQDHHHQGRRVEARTDPRAPDLRLAPPRRDLDGSRNLHHSHALCEGVLASLGDW
jgi:hypothetical protein